MRLIIAAALLFPAVAFAIDNCITNPMTKDCINQTIIKQKIKSKITTDEKLEKQLQLSINKQNHDHLKTKITDAHKAFLAYTDAECTAKSWTTLQKVLDDEGLEKIDQQIEIDTINQCKESFKKDRIIYLKNNY